ncbi:hypothetical protein [Gimesia sp.]|uniref:hypothetical protein n=1 Tax=Gimesia sp. TaxID=2024833 RepID=UPI000C5395AD|nr:hypothetical protein [Gimesia sp.]MAX40962.1 hypothetical protein [Gimesia sp.]HAH46707.1 hypothetical protein [Planctomycetaceae bacterium]HBL42039.1 hypothetical protein [Planctomycetaceae bacterium]|tara:strand:- start:116 stop:382 length:267 start_codon:yes stop_codon:yes gene_type:complete
MSEKKRWKVLHFLGYAIPILLLVYVLSIGPMCAVIYDSNGEPIYPEQEKMLTRFYSPLRWVVENNDIIEHVIITYIEICSGRDIEYDD